MEPKAVILSAGKGLRMLPLTEKIPKPLLPNRENSLLLNQINFIRSYTNDITITIGYLKNQMLEALEMYKIDNFIFGHDLGNAFWINDSSFNSYEGPLVVITCDNIMEIDINKLIDEYYKNGEKSILVGVEGIDENADKVKFTGNKITEIGKNLKSNIFLSGLQIINIKKIQKENKKFNNFYNVWESLINNKELIISEHKPESWSAIDTQEELNNYFNL